MSLRSLVLICFYEGIVEYLGLWTLQLVRLRSSTTRGQFNASASLLSIVGVALRVPASISLIKLRETSQARASWVLVSPACSRAYLTASGS